MPTGYPLVPGHEIVGRVTKVGSAVNKIKLGDLAGVLCGRPNAMSAIVIATELFLNVPNSGYNI